MGESETEEKRLLLFYLKRKHIAYSSTYIQYANKYKNKINKLISDGGRRVELVLRAVSRSSCSSISYTHGVHITVVQRRTNPGSDSLDPFYLFF